METVATTPKKVLVVDDDAIVVSAVENVLRAFQYCPLTSTQWTDALEIIHQEMPDLILLDLNMPNVDGPALLKFIRNQGYDIPVIVLSGFVTKEAIKNLEDYDVRYFVDKPFDILDLRAKIQSILEPNNVIRSAPSTSEVEETKVLVSTPVASKTSTESNKSDSNSDSSDGSKYKFRRKKRYSRATHINSYFIYGMVIGACVLLAGIVGLITHYSGQIDAERSEKLMDLRKDQREEEVRRQIEAILRQ